MGDEPEGIKGLGVFKRISSQIVKTTKHIR